MTRRVKVLAVLFLLSGGSRGQSASDILAYINTYKDLAVSEMQRTGIPASITLAQGIHETQAGTSDLVKASNNHFGIKCKETWTGSVVHHDDDTQGECFRSYSTPADSYRDHSDFLSSSARYQFLFKLDPLNYAAWAHGLKKAGYATNPQYPQILIRLITDYNLQQYSLIALGKLKPGALPGGTGQNNNNGLVAIRPGGAGAQPYDSTNAAEQSRYPAGEFTINQTRVLFAKAGTSLLAISDQYSIPLARLLEFNDLREEDVLIHDQLIFLQRKRKTGANELHVVQAGETLYSICQSEGIRYLSILQYNGLSDGQEPALGEKLNLAYPAPTRPALASEHPELQPPAPQPATPVDSSSKNTLQIVAPGQPSPITHVVQPKETLYSISKKYGVDAQKIQQWNKLDSLNLKAGQELIIYKD
jgi:LysM repeat protein